MESCVPRFSPLTIRPTTANHGSIPGDNGSNPIQITSNKLETSPVGRSILRSSVKRCPRRKVNNELTHRERIFILQLRGAKKTGFQKITEEFHKEYGRKISVSTVQRTIQRFEETGSIHTRPRSGGPRIVFVEDINTAVLQYLKEDDSASERELAARFGITRKDVRRILGNSNGIESNQDMTVPRQLLPYFKERFEFSERLLEMQRHDERFFHNIVFTDSSTFGLDIASNKHSHDQWETPRPKTFNADMVRPGEVNVWSGIVWPHVIGPFFLDDTLTVESYLELLRTKVIPRLKELFPTTYDSLYFQQEDSPVNDDTVIKKFLDQEFRGKWIGSRGPIQWPERSPDLSPLEFYYWDYIEKNLCEPIYRDEDGIRAAITTLSRGITPKMLNNVIKSFHDRLLFLGLAEGGSFEDKITE